MTVSVSGIAECVSSLQKSEKIEIVNYLLQGTGLIAISIERVEGYKVASRLRILVSCLQGNDRLLLSKAISEFLQSHNKNDDLYLFLEQATQFVSKATTKRKLQIIARQIYEQLRIDPVMLERLVQTPELLEFYMQFRCKQTPLIQIAKQIAEWD